MQTAELESVDLRGPHQGLLKNSEQCSCPLVLNSGDRQWPSMIQVRLGVFRIFLQDVLDEHGLDLQTGFYPWRIQVC